MKLKRSGLQHDISQERELQKANQDTLIELQKRYGQQQHAKEWDKSWNAKTKKLEKKAENVTGLTGKEICETLTDRLKTRDMGKHLQALVEDAFTQ